MTGGGLMPVGDTLPDTFGNIMAGMPGGFAEATSGALLGAAEGLGASAVGTALEIPFGTDFMVKRELLPDDAKTQTPASVVTTATNSKGEATEVETDPE
jgi:hypothetical protein